MLSNAYNEGYTEGVKVAFGLGKTYYDREISKLKKEGPNSRITNAALYGLGSGGIMGLLSGLSTFRATGNHSTALKVGAGMGGFSGLMGALSGALRDPKNVHLKKLRELREARKWA